jgi:hypothetical protein
VSLPSERLRPLDLGQIFAGAGQIMQFQQMRRAQERQQQIDAALQTGDMDRWRQLDPTGYANYASKMREGQKAELEMTKMQGQMVDDKAARTQRLSQDYLSRAQSDPRVIPNLMRLRDAAVASGKFDHFTLPGEDTADTLLEPGMVGPEAMPTRNEVRAAQTAAGADPYKGIDPDVREYMQVTGDEPGTPGFQQRFDARKLRFKKAGATNVNVGGKTMPAGEVAELADIQTASESLDQLLAVFNKKVPSTGVVEQIGSRVEGVVPNTSVSQYNDAALAAMQAVGLIMENGKLAAGDEQKYRKMFPKAGDSEETAAAKVANIKAMLATKARNRTGALSTAGFRPPTLGGNTVQPKGGSAPPTRTDPATGETRVWNGSAWVQP